MFLSESKGDPIEEWKRKKSVWEDYLIPKDTKIDEWDLNDKFILETRFLPRRVVTFKEVDMPLYLQAKTYVLARRGMLKYYNENDVARYISRNLMKVTVAGDWQVVIGTKFASAFTAEHQRYAYFWIGALGFLVFKIGSYNHFDE